MSQSSAVAVPFRLAPGLGLALFVATAVWSLVRLAGAASLAPASLALVAGAVVRTGFGERRLLGPGLIFAQSRLLRAGIVLLGCQVDGRRLLSLGGPSVVAVALLALACIAVTAGVARGLKVRPQMAALLAVGTAICGASAVAAAKDVVKARDEEAAYAVALISILGATLTVIYPWAYAGLGLSTKGYGFWAGASVHEVAQAVSAGFALNGAAGEQATITKLCRVVLLAPALVLVRWLFAEPSERGDAAGVRLPSFLWLFALVSLAVSLGWIPSGVAAVGSAVGKALLVVAMAAIGLSVDIRRALEAGARPVLLAVVAALTLSVGSLAVAKLWL
jgi:uncharacterized integral membrane protein (TIGR00698 family)